MVASQEHPVSEAAAMARRRWAKMTAEERSEHARMMNEARWKGKPTKDRKAAAKKAADARWGKKKGGKK